MHSEHEKLDDRLGALLTRLGLASPEIVERALTLGTSHHLSLGMVLVIQERVSADVVRAVVEAQSMIRDGALSEPEALKVVAVALRNGWGLQDALVCMGSAPHSISRARLGGLLVKAGTITDGELDEALELVRASVMSLGRVLISQGKIQEPLLNQALTLQASVRNGLLSIELAAQMLSLMSSGTTHEKRHNSYDFSPGKRVDECGGLSLFVFLKLCNYLPASKLRTLVDCLVRDHVLINRLLKVKNLNMPSSKSAIREIINDSDLLLETLSTIFPGDSEKIQGAHSLARKIESGDLSTENALIEYARKYCLASL